LLQLPLFLAAFLVAIFRLARGADIIHANWTPVALLALPCKYLLDVPVVCTYRGSDINKLPAWLNRFVMRHVNATINLMADTARGRSVRARFPGCYLDLPFIRREPLDRADADLSRFTPGLKHFVFVGRLATTKEIEKGVDLLVSAVAELSHSNSGFRVHVLGDGPQRECMEAQAKAVACTEHLHFYGFRENVFPYMQRADAIIGGLGLNAVVQEATSRGKLLLLADLPTFNGSIWEHRRNALLYDPQDASSLAATMATVLGEPRLCAEIAGRGADTAARYVVDVARGGEIYLEAFRGVIDSHPAPPAC
jgi:glycosyltransferase involved in cell wall biosynthesis